MTKWDTFWRWFNPPLPDVMQARMLSRVNYIHGLNFMRYHKTMHVYAAELTTRWRTWPEQLA